MCHKDVDCALCQLQNLQQPCLLQRAVMAALPLRPLTRKGYGLARQQLL